MQSQPLKLHVCVGGGEETLDYKSTAFQIKLKPHDTVHKIYKTCSPVTDLLWLYGIKQKKREKIYMENTATFDPKGPPNRKLKTNQAAVVSRSYEGDRGATSISCHCLSPFQSASVWTVFFDGSKYGNFFGDRWKARRRLDSEKMWYLPPPKFT